MEPTTTTTPNNTSQIRLSNARARLTVMMERLDELTAICEQIKADASSPLYQFRPPTD